MNLEVWVSSRRQSRIGAYGLPGVDCRSLGVLGITNSHDPSENVKGTGEGPGKIGIGGEEEGARITRNRDLAGTTLMDRMIGILEERLGVGRLGGGIATDGASCRQEEAWRRAKLGRRKRRCMLGRERFLCLPIRFGGKVK